MKKGMDKNNSNENNTETKKKKKKGFGKFIFSLILLLLCAGAVFIVGWIQFYVPNGTRAVVITKTSGVNPEVVKSGKFIWMWQRLLPTNTKIQIFSEDVFEYYNDFTESLPSADLFSKMISENPDFSYKINLSLKIKATDEKLLELVESINLETEQDLKKQCEETANEIFTEIVKFLVAKNDEMAKKNEIFNAMFLTSDEIKNELNLAEKYSGFDIIGIEIKEAKFPDKKLYELARASYLKFQMNMDDNLKKGSKEQADKILRDQRAVSILERIGEIFKKYPELKEAFNNSSFSDLMNLAD